MPKQKDVGVNVLPRELPMPKYEYQKPSTGSYSYRFEEKRTEEKQVVAAGSFCLQSLKLDN